MHYELESGPKKHRWYWFLVTAALLAAVLLLWIFHPGQASAPEPAAQLQPPKPDGLTSHILFVGDVFWGRRVQKSAEESGQGYSYLTSKLSKADRADYDAWIANFECPITTKDVPYEQQTDILRFNCRPEYLPNLAKWFTAASQANNHEDNNGGSWGLDQTRKNLQKVGIQYFSTYDMTKPDDLCEVITVPARTTVANKTVSLPIAMCGYMYVVDQTPTDAQLAVMRQYAKVMPVVAYPHMGVEYRQTGEPEKISAYHRMVDNGADMVVGAHPHVIQNSESYKGHLIAYSVGNFLFDQQIQGRNTTLGLGIGLKLTVKDSKAAKIYEQVAPACKTYKDDCLAKLQAKLGSRPKIDVSYNFACYDESREVGSLPQLGSKSVCALADKQATTNKLTGLSKQW